MTGCFIMMNMSFQHKFVDFVPEKLDKHTLYVCINYNTINHICPCGCGEEIVSPLSPDGWILHYNGRNITISPSVGNWSYKCQSHYWIRNNKIIWVKNDFQNYVDNGLSNKKKVTIWGKIVNALFRK